MRGYSTPSHNLSITFVLACGSTLVGVIFDNQNLKIKKARLPFRITRYEDVATP